MSGVEKDNGGFDQQQFLSRKQQKPLADLSWQGLKESRDALRLRNWKIAQTAIDNPIETGLFEFPNDLLQVFFLRYAFVEDDFVSDAEIGEVLGINKYTVKSIFKKILTKLEGRINYPLLADGTDRI